MSPFKKNVVLFEIGCAAMVFFAALIGLASPVMDSTFSDFNHVGRDIALYLLGGYGGLLLILTAMEEWSLKSIFNVGIRIVTIHLFIVTFASGEIAKLVNCSFDDDFHSEKVILLETKMTYVATRKSSGSGTHSTQIFLMEFSRQIDTAPKTFSVKVPRTFYEQGLSGMEYEMTWGSGTFNVPWLKDIHPLAEQSNPQLQNALNERLDGNIQSAPPKEEFRDLKIQSDIEGGQLKHHSNHYIKDLAVNRNLENEVSFRYEGVWENDQRTISNLTIGVQFLGESEQLIWEEEVSLIPSIVPFLPSSGVMNVVLQLKRVLPISQTQTVKSLRFYQKRIEFLEELPKTKNITLIELPETKLTNFGPVSMDVSTAHIKKCIQNIHLEEQGFVVGNNEDDSYLFLKVENRGQAQISSLQFDIKFFDAQGQFLKNEKMKFLKTNEPSLAAGGELYATLKTIPKNSASYKVEPLKCSTP